MYFKELDMTGFKSFCDNTVLKFEPGVTAIVGPNGCGKSNIVDAIRWVLGEQSIKELRGTNMEDVIFNGTDSRPALGMCEVSLTLDNSNKLLQVQYNEVTITRRLYRSGESEYLLNKMPVRLKDISELLMGTGIGTDSYSIIGQGKIDLVLSSKPEERRYVLEEASGITRYKVKKREAIRKLEQTDDNLTRLSDIISEVARQITSIERQARKAERYKELFEALKAIELKVVSRQLKAYTVDLTAVNEELSAVDSTRYSLQTETTELARRVDEFKSQLAEIDATLNELRQREAETGLSIDRNNDRISLNGERIKDTTRMREGLCAEISVQRKKLDELTVVLAELAEQIAAFTGRESEKKAAVAEKEGLIAQLEQRVRDAEQAIRRSKQSIIDMLNNQTHLRNEIVKRTSEIQHRSARLRRLETERLKVQDEFGAVNGDYEQIQSELGGATQQMGEAKEAESSLMERHTRIDARLQDVQGAVNDLEAQRIAVESKHDFLRDIVQRHEGFTSPVKEVFKAIESRILNMTGVRVVADILTARDGCEQAIERALRGVVQSLLVDTEQDAQAILAFLRQRNLGMTGIISREWLLQVGKIEQEAPLAEEGIIGRVCDFLEGPAEIVSLLRQTSQHIYLVCDLDAAMRLARRYPDRRFVTRDGEYAEHILVCAGSHRQETLDSLIGREQRLAQMKTQLEELAGHLGERRSEREEVVRESSQVKQELELHKATVRKLELELADKGSRLHTIREQRDRLQEELVVVEAEEKQTREEMESLYLQEKELSEQLRTAEQGSRELEGVINTSQEYIERSSKERELILVSLTQLRSELQALDGQKENIERTHATYQRNFDDIAEMTRHKEKETNECDTKLAALEEEIRHLHEANLALQQDVDGVRAEYQVVQERKETVASMGQGVAKDLAAKNEELNTLQSRIYQLELKKKDLVYGFETIKTRVLQTYKIELTEGVDLGVDDTDVDLEAAQPAIDEMRQRLDRMGPVNLVAIEEHKELQERGDFLTRQRDDLLRAKEDLQKAIRKINKTTKELFLDTFKKVRVEFKEFCRLLFNGGNGDLILLNEEDVLESGIEIIIKPPGKKLQSISLLSGGEKTMSAIALLLAIFKVKPSPFCILDEIDAALDESNIDRFSNTIKDFLHTSQFIIITHNKKTIALADVMYGITMQDRGVSKIISAKFTKDDETARPVAEAVPAG